MWSAAARKFLVSYGKDGALVAQAMGVEVALCEAKPTKAYI
jgi:hypothetical protein